jgi:DNA-binding MarR family transcriptional regulator
LRLADHPDGTLGSVAARLRVDRRWIEGLIEVLVERGLVKTGAERG